MHQGSQRLQRRSMDRRVRAPRVSASRGVWTRIVASCDPETSEATLQRQTGDGVRNLPLLRLSRRRELVCPFDVYLALRLEAEGRCRRV